MSLHRCRPILLCGLLFLATPPLWAADDRSACRACSSGRRQARRQRSGGASAASARANDLHSLRKAAPDLRKRGPRRIHSLRTIPRALEGCARARAQARRAQAADARGDHPRRQRSHRRQGSGPGRGAAQDRFVGERLDRSAVATGRRGRDFGQPNLARRQGRAGAIGGRCRRRLQAGDRE